jgi:hypothetical protein
MFGALLAASAVMAAQATPPVVNSQPEPVINTGAGLLENCTYDAKASGQADLEFHLGLCIGFIKGVTNTWAEHNPREICPPDEVTNEKLRSLVVDWLRSHPEALEATAVAAVVVATTEAFPCGAEVHVEKPSQGA